MKSFALTKAYPEERERSGFWSGHLRHGSLIWQRICMECLLLRSGMKRKNSYSVSETSLARSRSTIMRRKMDSFSMEQQSGESWSSQDLSKN